MSVPDGYYVGDDGLLRRKCSGECDTCPDWCFAGTPVRSLDDEEPDDDDDGDDDESAPEA